MNQFIAEIRIFAGSFAPKGWAFCQGQLLPINQNQALFSLLGTTYGGNGTVNFALPDLRGRVPIHVHQNQGLPLGKQGGSETATLTAAHLLKHTHAITGTRVKCNTSAGNLNNPTNNFPAGNTGTDYSYIAAAGANEFLADDAIVTTVAPVGNGQSFSNMMPYLGISYIIALTGYYPSRP